MKPHARPPLRLDLDGRATSRRRFLAEAAAVGLVVFGGCSSDDSAKRAGRTVATDAPPEDELLLSAYVDFFSPENRKRFARREGIQVRHEGYASEDELLARMMKRSSRYDAVVPSARGLEIMAQRGLALELNHRLLPHLRNLKPQFRGLEPDPELRFGVPKDAGIASFFWDPRLIRERPRTLLDAFELLPRHRTATVFFVDSPTEVIGVALAALGHSVNSEDDRELDAARDLLLRTRPFVDRIAPGGPAVDRGEYDAGVSYNGDVSRANAAGAKHERRYEFLVPEGKTVRFVDYWVIPARARHPVLAHRWIDYLLEPTTAAREFEHHRYNVPVEGHERLVDSSVRRHVIDIPAEAFARYEALQATSAEAERARAEIWTEFKKG